MVQMTAMESWLSNRKQKALAKFTSRLEGAREHFAEARRELAERGEQVLHDTVVSRPAGERMNADKWFYVIFGEKGVYILEENQGILTLKDGSARVKPYSEIALREGEWRRSPVFTFLATLCTFGVYLLSVPSSWAMAQIAVAEKEKWVWFGDVLRHRSDPDLDGFATIADILRERGGRVYESDSRIKPFSIFGSARSTPME